MRRINIGCGRKKLEGYINIDWDPQHEPDVVYDIVKHGLPFDSNSAVEIIADDFMEHCTDFVFVMNEIARVLKKGGFFKARFPPWDCEGAFQINHARPVTYKHFKMFDRRERSNQCRLGFMGEPFHRCFKMILKQTVKGKCPLWCIDAKHSRLVCHVILKKVLS